MNPQEVRPPDARLPPPMPALRRSRWRGSVLAVALVLLVAGTAWYLVQRANGEPAGGAARGGTPGGGRPMVTVGEAVARKALLPVVVDALGTVTPVVSVTLRAQVSGMLKEVLFTEGQMVKKGQLLAQIDPRPFEQALLQAQGTRQRNEAQLENARLTLQRYQVLWSQDSIARQDVDTQAALVKQLEGTVLTDKAQEGTARLNLGYTRVTAPTTGRIGLRAVDAGNTVSPGDAAGLATIAQVAPIDVQFSVPQDLVTDIRESQAAAAPKDMEVSALDRTRKTELAQGRFSTLDNQVDTATGTIKAKARFDNAQGALFPNQFVNVQLLLRKVPAVVVPVTAVRTGANGDFVYVIGADQKVTLRKVQRGRATVELMAIAQGLEEGERVVTEGGDRLQDGMAVQVAGARAARASRAAASGARAGVPGQRGGASGEGAPRRARAASSP